ncbi:hypothetical protein EI94DRAFT_1809356 [Lactarius quietus]|nr:hypothetical protein EI94DRAFT_1809356 [Lactarius quietus]
MQCNDITGLEGDEDIYNDPLPPSFFNTANEDDTGFEPYHPVGTLQDNTIFEPLPMDTVHVPRSRAQLRLLPVNDSSGDDDYGYEPFTADTLHVPKPQLRSRPPIDFSGQLSATPSLMSGSTLHPHLLAFPRKAASSIGLASRLSPETIASLTDIDLHHNPIYHKLRRKFYYVSGVLTKYMDRDFEEKQVAKSELPLQQNRLLRIIVFGAKRLGFTTYKIDFNSAHERSVNGYLDHVEAPSQRPSLFPTLVLWYYEDCQTDTLAGTIVTDANKRRLKMHLAIRRGDRSIISAPEYDSIRRSADIVVDKLIKLSLSRSHTSLSAYTQPASKLPMKSNIRKWFKVEYSEAIFELRLSKNFSAFLWHNDAECRQSAIHMHAVSAMPNPVQLHPGPAPIPQVSNLVPSNATKRSLELSPSPKSPSGHTFKSTAGTRPQFLAEEYGPFMGQRTVAHKITPQFLNRGVTIEEEPAPRISTLCPLSLCFHLNIIADLISQFPSLTNASSLITSMNSQPSFKQDINEDNRGQSWGHYQFTAGGLSPSSSLTTWQKIGNVNTALKLVAAALKTCQDVRAMCANAGAPKTSGFISDIYLEQILDCLEKCWGIAGGAIASRVPVIPITPPHHDNAMSGFKIKLKPLPLNADNATTTAPEPPNEPPTTTSTMHQQPAVDTELTQEPSAALHKGARADAISLKLLQIPELLAWANDNKLTIPKLKRKDDIIAAIVQTPEFIQVSKSTIDQIIEQTSQLLCHLGVAWQSLSPDDLPSPVPEGRGRAGPNVRPSLPEALAGRVPEMGPHCSALTAAPWEAPNWGPRLSFNPKTGGTSHEPEACRVVIRMLTEENDPSIALTHVVG